MLIHVKAVHYDFYKRRIGDLVAAFPHAFNKCFPHPLAIGIHKQIVERTDFTAKEVSVLLRVWTHRAEYLAMGQSIGSRIDLDGNLSLMSPEHVRCFVNYHKRMNPKFIKAFTTIFGKAFGRPAFLAVPISERQELFDGTKEKGCGGCGSSNCSCS